MRQKENRKVFVKFVLTIAPSFPGSPSRPSLPGRPFEGKRQGLTFSDTRTEITIDETPMTQSTIKEK